MREAGKLHIHFPVLPFRAATTSLGCGSSFRRLRAAKGAALRRTQSFSLWGKLSAQPTDEGFSTTLRAACHLIRHGYAVPPSPQGEGFGCVTHRRQTYNSAPWRANRLRSRQMLAIVRHRDECRPYNTKAISPPRCVAGGFQRGAHIPLWRAFFAVLPRFFPTRERNGVTVRRDDVGIVPYGGCSPFPPDAGLTCAPRRHPIAFSTCPS